MARREKPPELVPVELILGSKEHRREFPRLQRDMQAVLHVAEIHRRGIEPERRTEDDPHLPRLRGRRGGEVHPLGMVASLRRMGPDALVAVGTDPLAAAVEDKRDERLRNP